MDQIAVIAVSSGAGMICGACKDIIFAWLKGEPRKKGDACAVHEKRLALVELQIKQHGGDLEKGSRNFDELRSCITKIDKNVGILLDRAGGGRGVERENI